MISSLEIKGYRSFEHLIMSGLGRVNLLVGSNNSGKTSVLEALYLLTSGGDPLALQRVFVNRGERLGSEERGDRPPDVHYDLCHLFHGHKLRVGCEFSFSGDRSLASSPVTYRISEAPNTDADVGDAESEDGVGPRLALSISGRATADLSITLTRIAGASGLRARELRRSGGRAKAFPQYITTLLLSPREIFTAWDSIVLTPGEERVLRALQIIEPKISRIAASIQNYYSYSGSSRDGFKVKLADHEDPMPIGSLGEGIWRMLAMATALVSAKDGVLLIDDIDTGLHYSVMADMWKLIAATAKELNVQVFATTHSRDCVSALAKICREDVDDGSEVTIQRIEAGYTQPMAYTEAQIVAAAEYGIEVR